MMHSGISQAREFDDPPGLHEKTEYLLREWVNMYHSPAAGRDSTKAFSAFVQQVSINQHSFVGVRVPAVWCDPCTRVIGSNPTGGTTGLHTLVKPLTNCIINQLYSCHN